MTTTTEVFVGRYDGNLMGWEKNDDKGENDFNLFCAMAQLHMGCKSTDVYRAKTYVFFNRIHTHISSIKSKFILHSIPLCLFIHLLFHTLNQAIMHTYVTLEPQVDSGDRRRGRKHSYVQSEYEKIDGYVGKQQGTIVSLKFLRMSGALWLLSASDDGTVCTWRVKDWICGAVLQGHLGGVIDVAPHPSGNFV